MILDDATSEIYYAQLARQESTRSVMAGIRHVIEKQGIFCALYSDRASHFFQTPKAGEPVDKQAPAQVGRTLRDLRIQPLPGLFAAGSRTQRKIISNLAVPIAAGAQNQEYHNRRRCQ